MKMQNESAGFNLRLMIKMAELGVSQADLCRLTGLASSMISHYCTGQRIPSVPVAAVIAKALNTTIDYLAYSDDPAAQDGSDSSSTVAEDGAGYSPDQQSENSIEGKSLDQLIRLLNAKGRKKVLEYTKDLLSSGKYE
jgi:transcriptional regulator with XRE-family HTH domain